MAFSAAMLALEMAQETGRLLAWRRNEGDRVTKGEPLPEIETDKAVSKWKRRPAAVGFAGNYFQRELLAGYTTRSHVQVGAVELSDRWTSEKFERSLDLRSQDRDCFRDSGWSRRR